MHVASSYIAKPAVVNIVKYDYNVYKHAVYTCISACACFLIFTEDVLSLE